MLTTVSLVSVAFATRAAAILSDVLVIVLIVRHTWGLYMKTKGIRSMGKASLCKTLLFDGAYLVYS